MLEPAQPTTPKPFPYDRADTTLDNYLLRLLLAAVVEKGGELRVKAATILNIDPKSALIRTIDTRRGEIVLRFGSKHSEMYFVPSDTEPSGTSGNQSRTGPEEWQRKLNRGKVFDPRKVPANPPSNPNPGEMQDWLNRAGEQNQSRSRHVVIDDMRMWLTEQSQKEQRSQRQTEVAREERSERIRAGLEPPYRVVRGSRP